MWTRQTAPSAPASAPPRASSTSTAESRWGMGGAAVGGRVGAGWGKDGSRVGCTGCEQGGARGGEGGSVYANCGAQVGPGVFSLFEITRAGRSRGLFVHVSRLAVGTANDPPRISNCSTAPAPLPPPACLQLAIARGLAYAPYADLIWCETSTPDMQEAREFAGGWVGGWGWVGRWERGCGRGEGVWGMGPPVLSPSACPPACPPACLPAFLCHICRPPATHTLGAPTAPTPPACFRCRRRCRRLQRASEQGAGTADDTHPPSAAPLLPAHLPAPPPLLQRASTRSSRARCWPTTAPPPSTGRRT